MWKYYGGQVKDVGSWKSICPNGQGIDVSSINQRFRNDMQLFLKVFFNLNRNQNVKYVGRGDFVVLNAPTDFFDV